MSTESKIKRERNKHHMSVLNKINDKLYELKSENELLKNTVRNKKIIIEKLSNATTVFNQPESIHNE